MTFYKKLKSFIIKDCQIDIYFYKHGEIVGTIEKSILGIFTSLNAFDDFRFNGNTIVFTNPPNKGVEIKFHYFCE